MVYDLMLNTLLSTCLFYNLFCLKGFLRSCSFYETYSNSTVATNELFVLVQTLFLSTEKVLGYIWMAFVFIAGKIPGVPRWFSYAFDIRYRILLAIALFFIAPSLLSHYSKCPISTWLFKTNCIWNSRLYYKKYIWKIWYDF